MQLERALITCHGRAPFPPPQGVVTVAIARGGRREGVPRRHLEAASAQERCRSASGIKSAPLMGVGGVGDGPEIGGPCISFWKVSGGGGEGDCSKACSLKWHSDRSLFSARKNRSIFKF